jgi:hypothetical protein
MKRAHSPGPLSIALMQQPMSTEHQYSESLHSFSPMRGINFELFQSPPTSFSSSSLEAWASNNTNPLNVFNNNNDYLTFSPSSLSQQSELSNVSSDISGSFFDAHFNDNINISGGGGGGGGGSNQWSPPPSSYQQQPPQQQLEWTTPKASVPTNPPPLNQQRRCSHLQQQYNNIQPRSFNGTSTFE